MVTFDPGVTLLSPLRHQSTNVTMTSVPKVLNSKSYSSAGEEMTQAVTEEDPERERQRDTVNKQIRNDIIPK